MYKANSLYAGTSRYQVARQRYNVDNQQGRASVKTGLTPLNDFNTTRGGFSMKHDSINKECESPVLKWSANMAYIIGFTYADGYLVRTDNNKDNIPFYRLGWHLAHKDISILQRFKDELQLTSDIKVLADGSIDLRTTNQALCIFMLEKGVLPNKTKRLSMPDMPIEMEPHFIRGYFDGDGTVYRRKQKNDSWLSINIVGSTKYFLQTIGDVMRARIRVIPKIRSKGTYWVLEFNNMESIAIYRWLYDNDNSLFLDRKRQVFVDWLKNKNDMNYGLCTCKICNTQFTKLSDRSPFCKRCKPFARQYYNSQTRTYNWVKIQSELIGNNKNNT